jgi:Flp pilus assembly pilin Flp
MHHLEQENSLMIPFFVRALTSFHLRDEEGQTLVEYALILVLVSTAAFTLLSAIGGFPHSVFNRVNADF